MEFQSEKQFAEFIRQAGGILWLVGGAVRDEIMESVAHDRDYMVTGLPVEALPFEKIVGSDFPVFMVNIAGKPSEVAMARREKKTGRGYHGFTFFTDASVTVEEDLSRRDLTINAMAKNVLTGEVVDPFGGRTDIARKMLRHTSEAFRDDPLRVYRVARFAAKFGFTIASETIFCMSQMKSELFDLKVERVWKEVEKAFECSKPGRFFEALVDAGVLDVHFQEVADMYVSEKMNGTAFRHVMAVMNAANSAIERFGALVHHFEEQQTSTFCRRLRMPKHYETFGVFCVKEQNNVKHAEEMSQEQFVRWVLSNKRHIHRMVNLSFLDSIHRDEANYDDECTRFENMNRLIQHVFDVEKTVTGKALIEEGEFPGKHLGERLFERRVCAFQQRITDVKK